MLIWTNVFKRKPGEIKSDPRSFVCKTTESLLYCIKMIKNVILGVIEFEWTREEQTIAPNR